MKQSHSLSALPFAVILACGPSVAFGLKRISDNISAIAVLGVSVALAYIVACSIQVAKQWNKAVVFRLGRFRSVEVQAWSSLSPS